jgi:hypothetical protein
MKCKEVNRLMSFVRIDGLLISPIGDLGTVKEKKNPHVCTFNFEQF